MNAPTVTEGMVTMPKDEFEELLERVAERGARAALSDVGLDGENAANDIRPVTDIRRSHSARQQRKTLKIFS